jgi:molybdopterin-guanine dinucleotide biosynthesis adapter protein
MPPIISIVGKSGSGKTTFLEKLIREIASRGYKIATIKHTHHALTFDQPDKDSWRHARAGAAITMCSSSAEIQIIEPVHGEVTIEELARHFGEEYDLILTEGFSGAGNTPKIEIHRQEANLPLLNPAGLIALVTDEPLKSGVKQYGLDDAKGVADLLEETYLKPHPERVSLYVNGKPIPLSAFPRQIIGNVLLALADSLKGVKDVDNLEYRYRKGK